MPFDWNETTLRTNLILTIGTAVPRSWTNYPGGLTVDGTVYVHKPFTVSGLTLASDRSTVVGCELAVLDVDDTAGDLVGDAANLFKPITIRQVLFNEDWTIAGTKLLFAGETGKPGFRGNQVSISCQATLGRRGLSPARLSSSVLVSHTPPAETITATWVSLRRR